MTSIIFLFLFILTFAMTALCVEAKVRGWWVWATACLTFGIIFLSRIQS
jgi:hypothetical protein